MCKFWRTVNMNVCYLFNSPTQEYSFHEHASHIDYILSNYADRLRNVNWRLSGYCSYKITCPTIWYPLHQLLAWWRHQIETFSALLALYVGNSPITAEFLLQRPVTRIFDICFDLRLNKRLGKQSRGWWFETPSRSLWRHCNGAAVHCLPFQTNSLN